MMQFKFEIECFENERKMKKEEIQKNSQIQCEGQNEFNL